ncbi:GNAT family N-acetyltransferase [Pseudobacter ginsenosidimutans]|uniref:RimJ/RimL family protein N-acetyltransferase n=1 Tax=Pseudobacter ginsenosidimutans TaxID=661488 RepID=A0A4Q7N642_9BACT|nr:GNAT family N-acetyltransferase [Pseudobacter ginsenosidimutans]QEC45047.1 GNAT family N-acetyltransferase [Pseudobacter ginsenosidimutans]RZS76541.1 RimJ/RimL family protein N-acetyltransferase [Pseudobacter ginsenosidimutans]
MMIIETSRMTIRELTSDDAAFVLEIVNSPGWLQYIGDRGVKNLEGAALYIQKNRNNYQVQGFGLYALELKDTKEVVGMCGLLKRDYLPAPDIGYALLPAFGGLGFALEAGKGVMEFAQHQLGLDTVFAIVTPQNSRSIGLLEKLEFVFERSIMEGEELLVYRWSSRM